MSDNSRVHGSGHHIIDSTHAPPVWPPNERAYSEAREMAEREPLLSARAASVLTFPASDTDDAVKAADKNTSGHYLRRKEKRQHG